MLKQILAGSLAILLFAAVVNAHGNATHFMGTVTTIDGNHVTIKDKAGKSVVVMLNKATKYFKNKKAASTTDLQVGTRVVIDAKMDSTTKMWMAEEVQVGVNR